MTKKIFVSYSREDEALCNELLKHLSSLKSQGLVEIWHDRAIDAGHDWRQAIGANLDNADIILLLVSASFLSSEFCREIEMETALARHENQEVTVVPVILRNVDWKAERFQKLQALPKGALPVTLWRDQDDAFTNVAAGIRKIVEAPNPFGAHSAQPA